MTGGPKPPCPSESCIWFAADYRWPERSVLRRRAVAPARLGRLVDGRCWHVKGALARIRVQCWRCHRSLEGRASGGLTDAPPPRRDETSRRCLAAIHTRILARESHSAEVLRTVSAVRIGRRDSLVRCIQFAWRFSVEWLRESKNGSERESEELVDLRDSRVAGVAVRLGG
jgi:hypothetical protein